MELNTYSSSTPDDINWLSDVVEIKATDEESLREELYLEDDEDIPDFDGSTDIDDY